MAKKINEIVRILLGTFLLALSVEEFILPFSILSGGVAGIAVALEPFFHLDETIFANVLTLAFLILGRFTLGRKFILDSVLSSISYPVFTTILAHFVVPLDISPAIASLYAGLLGGIGVGIVMSTGASTGGVDIPTMILAKVFHQKIGTMAMILDGCTVLLGVIAYDLSAALIGLLSVFASSFAINRVLYAGQNSSKSVQIISDQWQTINARIRSELERGATILQAQGGYSGKERPVLLCVVSQRQYSRLLQIVHEVDKRAFIITTDASDMHGEGFTFPSPSARM
ncbi:MAG: YitT family protein [Lactimicrobium sp.]|uniref:YitT family protein n=1 Tax=Lactimicrobium sp. TaxID=2563780 RepID=UPI002F353158